MNKQRLIVHAVNVHSGGGGELLTALLKMWPVDLPGVLQVDQRMTTEEKLSDRLQIHEITANLFRRFKAEWWLRKNVERGDLVLCFGNMPPLFRLRGRVILFLQNRYLIEQVSLEEFSLKNRLRLTIERHWLTWRIGNVQTVIVQTPTMERLLLTTGMLEQQSVIVCPYLESKNGYFRQSAKSSGIKACPRLVYVASGEPHKNHKRLIEAWCQLAKEGVFPILALTLDDKVYPELWSWIQEKKVMHRLQIENYGVVMHDDIFNIYHKADALIYPSMFESLGIPLIEARQAQLPILASELDYVRDVVDPEHSFNPLSVESITRAVKRFLGVLEKPLPLVNSSKFIEKILGDFSGD